MEHFTWNNGYDEINKLEIQGTYDQFIGSYVCDEILPVCDTIIENMDFCEMVGLTRKRSWDLKLRLRMNNFIFIRKVITFQIQR